MVYMLESFSEPRQELKAGKINGFMFLKAKYSCKETAK